MKNMNSLGLLLIVGLLTLGLACSEADYVVNDDPSEFTTLAIPIDLSDLIDLYALPEDGSYEGNPLSPQFDPPDLADTSYDVYSVTLIWGNPSNDRLSEMSPMDWMGTLSVNGEAWVLPVRAILFEHEDHILENPSPSEAAWESVTHGGYDGISFLVFLKRGVIYIAEPMLSFNTEPLSQSWHFGRLKKLNAYYKTDAGAGLGIHAHLIQRFHCPKGLLSGHWIKDGDRPHSGHFEGIWMGTDTRPTGYYHGRFWMDHDGVGKFEGSVSGYFTDQVIAKFAGHWVYDDPRLCPTCGENQGLFKGRIKWLDHEVIGEMWGGFGGNDTSSDHVRLPMAGFWRMNCSGSVSGLPD